MKFLEIFFVALGLSADACAAAVSKGLAMGKVIYKYAFIIAFTFGFFQALMPWIGYLISRSFSDYISEVDHWIAFVLLSFIGIKSIVSAIRNKDKPEKAFEFKIREIIFLGIATSLDALAAGVSFAFLDTSIYTAILIIGVWTFIICFVGVAFGSKVGKHLKNKAEIIGGVILILIGLKILLEHLNVINF